MSVTVLGRRDVGTDKTSGHCGRKKDQGHSGSFCLLGRKQEIMSVIHDPKNEEVMSCVWRKVSYWHKFSVRAAGLLSTKSPHNRAIGGTV